MINIIFYMCGGILIGLLILAPFKWYKIEKDIAQIHKELDALNRTQYIPFKSPSYLPTKVVLKENTNDS